MKKVLIIGALVVGTLTLASCSGGALNASSVLSSDQGISQTSSQALSLEDIKKIALTHAGVSEDQIEFTKIEIEANPDGSDDYVLNMKNDLFNYTYKINGSSGKILNSSVEDITTGAIEDTTNSGQNVLAPTASVATPNTTPAPSTQATSSDIGEAKAKEIALTHAGVSEADVRFVKVERDYDNGRLVYEIEFYAGNSEYDYEILASSGEIVSYDYDIESFSIQQNNGSASTNDIGIAKAKEIALAKVPGATNNNIKIKRDHDDGRLTYEGEIIYNGMEYEFEILASTGEFVEWSSESIYD